MELEIGLLCVWLGKEGFMFETGIIKDANVGCSVHFVPFALQQFLGSLEHNKYYGQL